MMMSEWQGNYKYGFSNLEDALDFYEVIALQDTYAFLTATHVVKGRIGEEMPELYYVNVLSDSDKDSEADFVSRIAFGYEGYVATGSGNIRKEFNYLPGYEIIKNRS